MATTVAAESAPVATTPKKRGAPKKAGSKAKPSAHPAYLQMIKKAIAALKERGGSSRQKILQYVMAHNDVGKDAHKVNARLRSALKRGVATGVLQGSKGATATGHFRLAEKAHKRATGSTTAGAKKPKPKKARKSAVAKVGGVRTPKKKSPAKKSHKKAKPAAKKITAAPAAPATASAPAPKKGRGRPSGSPKKAAAKKSPARPKAGAKGRGRPKKAAH